MFLQVAFYDVFFHNKRVERDRERERQVAKTKVLQINIDKHLHITKNCACPWANRIRLQVAGDNINMIRNTI